MIIRRKRIRMVEKYINYIPEDKEFYVCVKNNAQNMVKRRESFCEKPLFKLKTKKKTSIIGLL